MSIGIQPHGGSTRLSSAISSLSAAIPCISASLDVRTALREAVNGACALTGTHYGFVVTVNDDFTIRQIVSCGLRDDQHRRFTEWADGPETFERLRRLSGSAPLVELPAFVCSLGISPDLMRSGTFQGAPMRHGERYAGHFFVAGKQDPRGSGAQRA